VGGSRDITSIMSECELAKESRTRLNSHITSALLIILVNDCTMDGLTLLSRRIIFSFASLVTSYRFVRSKTISVICDYTINSIMLLMEIVEHQGFFYK